MRKISYLVCVVAVAACGGKKSDATVSHVSAIAGGDQCPHGGLVIASGADKNGNGVLDLTETTSTQVVCQTVDAKLLSVSTPFGVGQNGCAYGGVLVSIGLDNGDGGGVANDGVLQTGEPQTATISCNVQPSVGTAGSTTPPADQAGQSHFTIDTHGGSSAATGGGAGGAVSINVNRSANQPNGDLKIFRTGLADTTCAAAAAPPYNGGALGWTVSASQTTIGKITQSTDLPGTGTYYIDATNHVFLRGATSDALVTGLEIPAGLTLTIDVPGGGDDVPLVFANDVHIGGSLTVTDNVASLEINTHSYVSDQASHVDMSGHRVSSFVVHAPTIFNHGTIAGVGAPCTSSGDAGSGVSVSFYASSLTTTGAIHLDGGSCTGANAGGSGGSAYLKAADGILCSTGDISTSGGKNGIAPALTTNTPLTSIKPTISVSCGSCGGNAGQITFLSASTLVSAGALTAAGGDGYNSGRAGDAASITIGVTAHAPLQGVALQMSGSVDTHGGANGATGSAAGRGGRINIYNEPTESAIGSVGDLVLFGYTKIDTHSGTSNGALVSGQYPTRGGQVDLVQDGAYQGVVGTGAVINYADIDTHGGDNAATSPGAPGGRINMDTPSDALAPSLNAFVFNQGALTTSGGHGQFPGASAGNVSLSSEAGAQNLGDITANSGPSLGGAGQSSRGAGISILAYFGDASNSGHLTARGSSGDTGFAGGMGGYVEIAGTHASNTSSIDVSGGNSGGVTYEGGVGGSVDFFSSAGGSAPGAVNVSGGTGADLSLHSGTITLDVADPRSNSNIASAPTLR